MATIKKFEELECWKRARELCNLIYEFINYPEFSKDYKLKDQINGSSGSAMDNIAEGFERRGNKEFHNFLSYSRGSAGEVKSQLYRAYDRKYINKEEFDKAFDLADQTIKAITGLMVYLKNSELKGVKYLAGEDDLESLMTMMTDDPSHIYSNE